MSLQIDTTFDSEMRAREAVHRICEMHFYSPALLVITVGVWSSLRASQSSEVPAVERRVFEMHSFDPKAEGNWHTQAYAWLKSQPAYAEAIDV